MNLGKHAPRFLGAAFLIVVLTSGISGMLLLSVIGSGSMSEMLTRISNNIYFGEFPIILWLAFKGPEVPKLEAQPSAGANGPGRCAKGLNSGRLSKQSGRRP